MNQIICLVIVISLFFYITRVVISWKKEYSYRKAGKKWDNIVKELREKR